MLRKIFTENLCKILFNEDVLQGITYTGLVNSDKNNTIAFALNIKLLKTALVNPAIKAILIPPILQDYIDNTDKCIILTDNPEEIYYIIHNQALFAQNGVSLGFVESYISPTAKIHPTAIIEDDVYIADNVTISAYSVVGRNTYIAENTYIGPHCVISEDGLYVRNIKDGQEHITHYGGVRIGKNCRIGAHSTIGRAVYYGEYTIIEDDVIIGYSVIIAHEACIKKRTQISSQSLVAGRTIIGEGTWIGAGVTVTNSIEVGEKSSLRIGSVVINNLPAKSDVSGNLAISHKKNLINMIKCGYLHG